jgi:hypothetical protein
MKGRPEKERVKNSANVREREREREGEEGGEEAENGIGRGMRKVCARSYKA